MDAVKFIEERNRMCGTMSEVWGVDAAQIVKNTEEWSAAHPRKTRQSVFLEQWPNCTMGMTALSGCVQEMLTRCMPAMHCSLLGAPTAAVSSGCRRWSDGTTDIPR